MNGTIPTEIGAWTPLVQWSEPPLTAFFLLWLTLSPGRYLAGNSFTGQLPTEIGRLVALDIFQANSVLFTGSLPTEIGNMVSLRALTIGNCRFTGLIPSEIQNMASLLSLSVASPSPLTSPSLIRSALARDLGVNFFTGTIPSEIFSAPSINYMSVPLFCFPWFPPLPNHPFGHRDLSYNQFYGSIPSEIANAATLTFLDLALNLLTGKIPADMEAMGLQSMIMADNWFCPLANYSTWAPNNDYFENNMTCSMCYSFTCRNGGTCTTLSTTFNCTCAPGYFGGNCESALLLLFKHLVIPPLTPPPPSCSSSFSSLSQSFTLI